MAANPAGDGSTALLAAAVPFVAAIAILLIYPLLAEKIKAVIRGQITEDANSLNVPMDRIPLRLISECIGDYIEYAADAVQVFPLTLLPVSGAIFAIAANIPSAIALGYLGVVILAAVAVEAWILSQTAARYVARDRLGYSVTTVVGIMSNLLGLAMILIYRP
ncbi:MAG: hypothetical protein ACRDQ4_17585 [Pseudonocardiaceae bacterium]